jgi:hypothetical protein
VVTLAQSLCYLSPGWSKIPEASILVSILSESESELVSADGIDSSVDSNDDSTNNFQAYL